MDKLITKEEAIANCLKRFTVNNTDRLHLEAAFTLVYASGYRDGLKFAEDCYTRKDNTPSMTNAEWQRILLGGKP